MFLTLQNFICSYLYNKNLNSLLFLTPSMYMYYVLEEESIAVHNIYLVSYSLIYGARYKNSKQ